MVVDAQADTLQQRQCVFRQQLRGSGIHNNDGLRSIAVFCCQTLVEVEIFLGYLMIF